jgi:hypothetical protein
MTQHRTGSRDLLDEMELGFSYEMLMDEVYMPVHESRGWIRSDIIVNNDTYSAYIEDTGRFLFKAKLINGVFYISTNEYFDPIANAIPTEKVAARLM